MMRSPRFPMEKELAIVEEWRSMSAPTVTYFVDKYHVSTRTLARVIKKYELKQDSTSRTVRRRQDIEKLQIIQDDIRPKLIEDFQLHGDALITADYHNPCSHIPTVEAACNVADMHGIKRLIIAGDYFNLDILSYYSKQLGGDASSGTLTGEELPFGSDMFKLLSDQFDTIIYTMGNHEARFSKAVCNALTFEIVTKWLEQPNLRFVDRYWLMLDNIRITHPKSYSQVKLSVASRLCDKYNCDVISMHGHFLSAGYSRGGYRAVDGGCMADWKRIAYMNKSETTHPIWNNGFVLYKHGQLRLYGYGFGL